MKKIFSILFVSTVILIATAPNTSEPGSTGTCTGGACVIEDIKSNNLFNNSNIFAPEGNYSPPQPTNPTNTDGLSNTPFTYDQNCQFGNCVNAPAGSTE